MTRPWEGSQWLRRYVTEPNTNPQSDMFSPGTRQSKKFRRRFSVPFLFFRNTMMVNIRQREWFIEKPDAVGIIRIHILYITIIFYITNYDIPLIHPAHYFISSFFVVPSCLIHQFRYSLCGYFCAVNCVRGESCFYSCVGRPCVPLELKVLGALRVMGRDFTFDDCEDCTDVSEEVASVMNIQFIYMYIIYT